MIKAQPFAGLVKAVATTKAEARIKETASALSTAVQTLTKLFRRVNIGIVRVSTFPDSALMDIDGDLSTNKWRSCMNALGFKDVGDHFELPDLSGVGLYYDSGIIKVKLL